MDCTQKGELIAQRLNDAGLFTNRFGTFAKADFEILMFSIYLDMLEKPARDYDISIELGLTESKVRLLRTKAQLLYPKPLLWSNELMRAIQNGSFDPNDYTLTLMIEDPSTQNFIKNQIEKQQGIVKLNFNPKHLTLPIESYILLAAELDEHKETAIERLNKKWLSHHENAEAIKKEDLLNKYWSKNKMMGSIKLLLECAEGAWPAVAPIIKLIQNKIDI